MDYLRIENFKCFYNIEVGFNRLTVLAGANGNGKSTTIQALLFLRRTIEHCAQWDNAEGFDSGFYSITKPNGLNVELNGSYCLALGNSNYILPRNYKKDTIELGITNGVGTFKIVYDSNDGELWLTPIAVVGESDKSGLFMQEFYYLNAERMGPRISQAIKFYDYPNAGFQGEYVAQLLGDTNFNYNFRVDEKRKHSKAPSPYLEQQVNAWLNEIMPGVKVSASYSTETHSAQVRVDNYFTKGEPTIATNIGFGISYVLPILVTGLIAKSGSYMVVENPEAHLHPSAQSKIGRFLAHIAQSGVNVIVETHSDHIINGVQISAAKAEIKPELVTINFFSQKEGEPQPDVEPISINKLGELSKWPTGFFDQSQIDFAELFKIRKG
ncbi:DUF3696 domain-containing protein [Mucilaginibacter sp. RS28]|uniref:DUF3696 domain-containing protein n=1 Tax=Mucilaginibacter straminoryzae TaxID=2932774 RepID=A0A9X2B9N9_9SPHI|nr:DUF3696 domain-containing protein [Mucilaginibacter straminoryzae]MCJ8209940.1 DUF3696 domain-containing protein [Mucilaginibacter straminoryzae]